MKEAKTILLIEDDPIDTEITLNALKGNNLEKNVITVNDGEEALDYLYRRKEYKNYSSGKPMLIMLDIKMPKLDGFDVLQRIKNDENLRIIPTVIVTSSKEESDLLKAYKLGANGYVVKSIEMHHFIHSIQKLGTFWTNVNEPPPGCIRN